MSVRNVLLLIVLCSVFAALPAEVYLKEFRLSGYTPIKHNRLEDTRFSSGINMRRGNPPITPRLKEKTVLEIDHENQRIFLYPEVEGIRIGPGRIISFDSYLKQSTRAKFQEIVADNFEETLKSEEKDSGTGLFKKFEFSMPKNMPRSVTRVLGKKKLASLNIDGSQKLTLSGSSTVRENPHMISGGDKSDFDLQMLQELRLSLRGTIGEKIHVNIQYTSISDESLLNPNVIEIKYVGTEDEIIQSIEGGNISLSLPGSQYVGYSFSSEGLFGLKSELKIGDLDITAIVGKEEGEKNRQKYTGTSQRDSVTIRSRDFVPRTHYYMVWPYSIYNIYGVHTEMTDNVPSGWNNNAIATGNGGEWIIVSPDSLPKKNTPVRVFLDDNNYTNDVIETIDGVSWKNPSSGTVYNFQELTEGSDFYIDYDTGILVMDREIRTDFTIGIIYETLGAGMVGNATVSPIQVKLLRKENQDANTDTWLYQMRNVYKLPLSNINNEDFNFDIYTENTDRTFNYNVPSDVNPPAGYSRYIDYLRMDSNNDDQINADDNTIDLTTGYVTFPYIEPFLPLGDSIYTRTRESIQVELWHKHMFAAGKATRDQISLNQMNILKNSVKVTVDGETLTEGTDYLVDYDFGTIQFLSSRAKDADADIVIDYEYKPLFAVDSRLMAGLRADMHFNESTRIGGTFVYYSETVSDKRPKIGNENRTQIMADIDGAVKVYPDFMTTLVDWIPLIQTDQESEVELSGEVAMNIPIIYGKSDKMDDPEAYLDDMESILDTYTLGTAITTWSEGSRPWDSNLGKAEISWYNPADIYMKDVYDDEDLSDEDKNEKVSLMQCRVDPPVIGSPGIDNRWWGGIMKYIGNRLDFSDKQYIEIMVKTVQPDSIGPVTMHIDMGDISEDFYTRMGGEGVLNTEDGKYEGDYDGTLDASEDVGLDGWANNRHPEFDDPIDDYDEDEITENGYKIKPWLNRTEGNGKLDTEDLDMNGSLNTTNRYFEYTLSLDGSEFLEDTTENGYRIYRIPVRNPENYRVITNTTREPDLREVSYVRLWFEAPALTYVNLVNVDVVGNKWEETPIKVYPYDDWLVSSIELTNNQESMQSGIVDNQMDHYKSPPGTSETENGVETLEQSLAIDYKNLQPEHYGLARQKFNVGRNTSYNLLAYGQMRMWLYPELPEGVTRQDSIDLIVRLGADSLNYYEISYRMQPRLWRPNMVKEEAPDGWDELRIDFSKLTYVKELAPETNSDTTWVDPDNPHITYRKVRGPTLSNVREMSLGVKNPEDGVYPFTGRIHFNDIRVAEPFDDTGYAARATLKTKFADFIDFNADLTWQTPNFYSISTTGNRNNVNTAMKETVSLSMTNKYYLHKFFPAAWGISFPLTLSRVQSEDKPRYMANSDILVEDLTDPEEQDRQTTKSLTRSANVSLSQNKSLGHWALDYTVKNLTFNGDISMVEKQEPTRTDTTLSYNQKYNYNLSLPKESIGIRIWPSLFNEYSFYFIPNQFNNMASFRFIFPKEGRWERNIDGEMDWVRNDRNPDTRSLETSNTVKWDILTDLSTEYKLDTKRNLMWEDEIYGLNIGREKQRIQTISSQFRPRWADQYYTFSTDLSIRYDDNQKETRVDTLEIPLFEYRGGVNRDWGVNVTLKNSDMLRNLADWIAQSNPAEEETSDEEKPDEAPGEKGEEKEPEKEEEKKPEEPPVKEDDLIKGNRGQKPGEFEPVKGGDSYDPDLDEKQKEAEAKRREEEERWRQNQNKSDNRNTNADMQKGSGPLWWSVYYLSRLDNFGFVFDHGYESDFDYRLERPDARYQLSFPDALPMEDLTLVRRSFRYQLDTGLPITENLDADLSYTREITLKTGSSDQESEKTIFPAISLTMTSPEQYLGFDETLTSSRLTSNYTYTEELAGYTLDRPRNITETTSFSPLLSWTANWDFDLSSTISYSMTHTLRTTDNETNVITRNADSQRFSLDLNQTVNLSRGLIFPYFGTLRLDNDFTFDLSISYETDKEIRKNQQSSETERDRMSYNVELGGSYNFHKNFDGGSTIGYEYSHNKKNDETLKKFTLSIWVEILF